MKQGYLQILKLRNYRIVLTANFINRLGDSIDMIAFTWLTFSMTQSASWSAVMFAVNQLPAVLFMPLSGAFIEGLNKKASLFSVILCAVYVLRSLLIYVSSIN